MGLFNREDKFLKKARKQADQVVALKERFAALDDAALAAKTQEFKHRVQAGESLDALLPEVFAQVREASRRVLGMEHYYVQILGGIILHNGDIAEMKTGEGKTLAATLPVCLNALTGKGVHVVTVNEYLARRDSEWMGKLYRFLGFSVGLLERDADITAKQQAYQADITYGTNNEFGFDYLRDNMKVYQEELVQRELHYAIVDEVDSILIDEARTPLIISGSGDESSELYARADAFVRGLQAETDYEIDETNASEDDSVVTFYTKTYVGQTLTLEGREEMQERVGFYLPDEAFSDEDEAVDLRQAAHKSLDYLNGAVLSLKVTFSDGTEENYSYRLDTGKIKYSYEGGEGHMLPEFLSDEEAQDQPYLYGILMTDVTAQQ